MLRLEFESNTNRRRWNWKRKRVSILLPPNNYINKVITTTHKVVFESLSLSLSLLLHERWVSDGRGFLGQPELLRTPWHTRIRILVRHQAGLQAARPKVPPGCLSPGSGRRVHQTVYPGSGGLRDLVWSYKESSLRYTYGQRSPFCFLCYSKTPPAPGFSSFSIPDYIT